MLYMCTVTVREVEYLDVIHGPSAGSIAGRRIAFPKFVSRKGLAW